MIKFTLNGKEQELDVDPQMPLLWVLRDVLQQTGTKFGCGRGLCGACTVLMDKQAIRSCITPISALAGKSITTIEGLSTDGNHPLQQAWQEFNVPQCGYCQPGQIMNAAGLLHQTPSPSREQIRTHMAGNICRCGTYARIENAIAKVAEANKQGEKQAK
jgi:isoquinoline 1-oxidoreductase alpha subunit